MRLLTTFARPDSGNWRNQIRKTLSEHAAFHRIEVNGGKRKGEPGYSYRGQWSVRPGVNKSELTLRKTRDTVQRCREIHVSDVIHTVMFVWDML